MEALHDPRRPRRRPGHARGAFAGLLDLEPDIEVVAVAEDGEQGLAAVAEHQPDILLTDIEMPGMTGLELASRLKGNPTVRVVIVTTFARSGYLRRALDAGVSGYVLKDSPIEELADTLRRVAAGNRNRSGARSIRMDRQRPAH